MHDGDVAQHAEPREEQHAGIQVQVKGKDTQAAQPVWEVPLTVAKVVDQAEGQCEREARVRQRQVDHQHGAGRAFAGEPQENEKCH